MRVGYEKGFGVINHCWDLNNRSEWVSEGDREREWEGSICGKVSINDGYGIFKNLIRMKRIFNAFFG